jgi:hypothetical protein
MQTSVRSSFRTAVVATAAGIVAGVALVVAAAGPAAAKGAPEGVAIALPGEEPVVLAAADGGNDGADPRVVRLAEDLGMWAVIGDGEPLLPEAPTEYLGPSMTVEWTLYNPVPANPDAAPRIVQTVYPQAGGGALVHTEGGQRSFGQRETLPGWFRAPDRLVASLEAVGVETTFRLPEPAPVPGDLPAPAADPSGPAPATIAAAGAAVLVMLGISVPRVVGHRRRAAEAAPG